MKSAMERRLVRIEVTKTAGGAERTVRVGGDIWIMGLSEQQAELVERALRYAQENAVRAVQREMKTALGIE